MSVDITTSVMQRYYVNELKEKINSDRKRLIEMEEELRRQCSHPYKYLEVTRKYDSGGYDYVSSVTITKICTLCDTIIEQYKDPNHRGNYA